MALLVDTGPLELLRRRERRIESLALQYYPPVLPLPAVGEFLYGQLLAHVAAEALMRAQEFLAGFETLAPDATTALTYARLRSQAKQGGHTMPDADYWIAALAIQHRLRLLTMDGHFEQLLPDLRPWLIRVSV
ncbi:MAG: PIN domain-containing protein [Opitutaceae bacterium]|nr:PIN domain-containing protein [Opitutaceae bacterium]